MCALRNYDGKGKNVGREKGERYRCQIPKHNPSSGASFCPSASVAPPLPRHHQSQRRRPCPSYRYQNNATDKDNPPTRAFQPLRTRSTPPNSQNPQSPQPHHLKTNNPTRPPNLRNALAHRNRLHKRILSHLGRRPRFLQNSLPTPKMVLSPAHPHHHLRPGLRRCCFARSHICRPY